MELKSLLIQFINLNFIERKNNRKRQTRGIHLHQIQHSKRCGKSPSHARNSCPAKDAVCCTCTKNFVHFAKVCKSKVVAAVEQQGENSDSSEVFLGAVSASKEVD